MEWSDWSSCVNICVKEAGVDFGSVQARSRAVLAQEPENLQLCPDQMWESQPCTSETPLMLTAATANSSEPLPGCFQPPLSDALLLLIISSCCYDLLSQTAVANCC